MSAATVKARPWPTDLAFDRAGKQLRVTFDTGEAFAIPFELLRVQSPSAEVRGHRASENQLVPRKADVGVKSVEPVGRYAVRILFDDGHDTGLYSWDYLYEMGKSADARMVEYVAALEKAGLKRR